MLSVPEMGSSVEGVGTAGAFTVITSVPLVAPIVCAFCALVVNPDAPESVTLVR